VASVGAPAVAARLDRLPGGPLDVRQASSRTDALSQIDDREDAAATRLNVRSSAMAVSTGLRSRHAPPVRRLGRQPGGSAGRPSASPTSGRCPPRIRTAPPRSYVMIAWTFGRYFGATLIGVIGTPRSRSRERGASADRKRSPDSPSSAGFSASSCCA
jgi:hypothetical protein